MSSNPPVESVNPEAAPVAALVKPKGLTSSDLHTKVSESIAASAPRVIDFVVKTLADKEVDRRASLLLGAIDLATAIKRDLNKIDRPDIVAPRGRDNKPIGEDGYSVNRLKEIKKLTEKLAKVEKAIDFATRETDADWSLLSNLKSEMEKADKGDEAV